MSATCRVYMNEYNPLLGDCAYLPLTSGKLQAYAQTSPSVRDYYQFMPYIFHIDVLESILERIESPDIAAFSVQIWNEQLSLKVAEEIKRRFPECLVIFGGTQVPHDPQAYMQRYPFIDIASRGEGEPPFKGILERFISSREFDGIPNVTWRDRNNGRIMGNAEQSQFEKDLDVFPSPYLLGLYDQMLHNSGGLTFQAIIETNRGCPFRCSYCYWGKGGLSRKYRYFSLERTAAEVEWIGMNRIEFVYNADSNFGMHERDVEIARMFVENKKKYGCPDKVVNLYGKNTDDRIYNIAKMLYDNGMHKGLGLSRQTLSDDALKNIRRANIKLSVYKSLETRFAKEGIPTFTELILGLPGETYESFVAGIGELMETSLHCQMMILLCEIYPNTELGEPEYQKEHGVIASHNVSYGLHSLSHDKRWVTEYIDYVIGTRTMPTADWRRAGVVSWATMTLTSFRLGYFILEYLHQQLGIPYLDFILFITDRRMKEGTGAIMRTELAHYEAFMDQIIAGKGRNVVVPEFGDIYWAIEEASFLRISSQAEEFYAQMLDIVREFLISRGAAFDEQEVAEAVMYQQIRVPTPLPPRVTDYTFNYSFPEFFDSLASDHPQPLRKEKQYLTITEKPETLDKQRFAKERLLWGRRGGKFQRQISWHT